MYKNSKTPNMLPIQSLDLSTRGLYAIPASFPNKGKSQCESRRMNKEYNGSKMIKYRGFIKSNH